jgi:hypothetical protein
MSLINGGFSLIRFKLGSKIGPETLLKGLQTFKANDVLTAEKNESFGWASGQNFLDTKFTADKISIGSYFLFSFRLSSKKVPANLIRAHCQQEELQVLKDSKKEFLSRFEKSEIKADIKTRLLEEQPIEYKAYDCLLDSRNGVLYFTGTSKRIITEFIRLFEFSFSMTPLLLDAVGLSSIVLTATNFKALKRSNPSWFSPLKGEIDSGMPLEEYLGPDFLTWVWYQLEQEQAEFEVNKEKVSLVFEEFLFLKNPFSGPQESMENTIKDGVPTLCPEATAALYCGKKLYQSKVLAVIGENIWSFRFDGSRMSFSGIKLPSIEEEHEDDVLIERFEKINELTDIMDAVYLHFLEEYLSDDWEKVVDKMRKWIKAKKI